MAQMNIVIFGAGRIGATLARLWVDAGHTITFGTPYPDKLDSLVAELGGRAVSLGNADAAMQQGPVVVAVPFKAWPELAEEIGPSLADRPVLDTTNLNRERDGEIADRAADHPQGTLGLVAELLPDARLVKGLNTIVSTTLASDAHRTPTRWAVPLAGDDDEALQVSARLVTDAGFEPVLVGGSQRAVAFDEGAPVWNNPMEADELRRHLDVGETDESAEGVTRRSFVATGMAGIGGAALAAISGSRTEAQTAVAGEAAGSQRGSAVEPRAPVVRKRLAGKHALMQQLIADGVTHIFGNPGSTEQGFMDVLRDYPQLTYVLALHEGVAVSMADAYARATDRPAFVQLHVSPGLGNASGMLYNALITDSPLVVYVGNNDSRALFQEPLLSGPLVEMGRPVCKESHEETFAGNIPQALRRAFKTAQNRPGGPYLLSITSDALDAEADVEIVPTTYASGRFAPDGDAFDAAARMLLDARNPMIMVGDGVGYAGAQAEVAALAELLGAPFFDLASSAFANGPRDHSLNLGGIFYVAPDDLRETLADCDVLLTVGASMFPVNAPAPKEGPDNGILPDGTTLIQIDDDPHELGKNISPAVALLADPKSALAELTTAVTEMTTPAQTAAAARRRTEAEARVAAKREDARSEASARWSAVPIIAPRLMNEIRQAMPANAMIVSEGISNEQSIERAFSLEPEQLMGATAGPGLGAGLPAAIGAQLAKPDSKVVGIVSDGAAMYSIAALWTAAHLKLPVTYVILNNGGYHVLKLSMISYYGQEVANEPFIGMDLTDPALRFDAMAQSMGVRGWRVEQPDQLAGALSEAMAFQGPSLVDVVIAAPLPA